MHDLFPYTSLSDILGFLYQYKREGGLWGGITLRLGNIVVIPILTAFIVVLIGFVRWDAVMACADATLCAGLPSVLDFTWSWRTALAVIQTAAVGLWWLAVLLTTPMYIRRAVKMHTFVTQRLRLTDVAVVNDTWSTLTHAVQVATGIPRVQLHAAHMRRDNFWVAIHAANMLQHWRVRSFQLHGTTLLRWVLNVALFDVTYSKDFSLDGTFTDARVVYTKLVLCAACMILLSPALLPFAVMYVIFRKAEEMHAQRSSLFQRVATERAAWLFREFNEPADVLDCQLALAIAAADQLAAMHKSPVAETLASMVRMVCGVCVGALLCLALIDERILVNMSLGSHNLLWYLSIAAMCAGVMYKRAAPLQTATQSPDELVARLRAVTHHRLFTDATTTAALAETYFPPLATVLLRELTAVVALPIFVLFFLRKADVAELIARLQRVTRSHGAQGAMCVYGMFDSPHLADFEDRDDFLDAIDNCIHNSDVDICHSKMQRSMVFAHILYGDALCESAQHLLQRAVRNEQLSTSTWPWARVAQLGSNRMDISHALFYWMDAAPLSISEMMSP